jgi:hypothetical protein
VGDAIEINYLLTLMRVLANRLSFDSDETPLEGRCRGDIGAMTTETVIIVAGLAALALAVVAIIVAKVTEKANSIPTN